MSATQLDSAATGTVHSTPLEQLSHDPMPGSSISTTCTEGQAMPHLILLVLRPRPLEERVEKGAMSVMAVAHWDVEGEAERNSAEGGGAARRPRRGGTPRTPRCSGRCRGAQFPSLPPPLPRCPRPRPRPRPSRTSAGRTIQSWPTGCRTRGRRTGGGSGERSRP